MGLFEKPISEIALEDLDEIVAERWVENARVEFKAELPGAGAQARWTNEAKVKESARDKLLRETIGFANALGGYLILGIAEDEENRASELRPLAHCDELAKKLRQQVRECIEPSLPAPSFEIRGVPAGDDGAGYVVARVGPSLSAPHRLISDSQCYVRRGDETVAMTMPEIQDMSIRVARGAADVDSYFDGRSSAFRQLRSRVGGNWVALRVSFRPIWPIGELRAFGDRILDDIMIPAMTVAETPGGGRVELAVPFSAPHYRPVIRGCCRCSTLPDENPEYRHELLDDGGGEISLLTSCEGAGLTVHWVMYCLHAAVNSIDHQAKRLGQPGAQYALDWEVDSVNSRMSLLQANGRPYGAVTTPQRFPTLPVGEASKFEEVLNVALEDLLGAFGVRPDQWSLPWSFDFEP